MFNPKVAEIYDAKTVEVFKPYADRMEKEGRRVVLAIPADQVEGQVFPCFVGIDNYSSTDIEEVFSMYEFITEGRPEFEADCDFMWTADYKNIATIEGAIELWIK